MATAASSEVTDDDLVVVEVPAVEMPIVETTRRRLSSWARRVLATQR